MRRPPFNPAAKQTKSKRSRPNAKRAAMAEALERRTLMASIVVNSVADDGAGTLRQAITAANADPAADTITFDLGAGAHTINLASALPDLTTDMNISGPGAELLTVRRDTGGEYRIFHVENAGVSLVGMTISNGFASGFGADGSGSLGGGVYVANYVAGFLVVDSCTITGNTASDGGGIFGLWATVTITNTTISNNIATGAGGGIEGGVSTITIINSTISGNSAGLLAGENGGVGGGIFNEGPDSLIIRNSTLNNNSARDFGGGIFNVGYLDVTNSTFAANSAGDSGGGMWLYSYSVNTISNCTIAANNARDGGGILSVSPFAIPRNCLIALNTGGDFADFSGNIPDPTNHNFIGDTDGDPMLGPLADNGGPTQTMALLPGSPCINAGDPDFVSPQDFDQRGAPFARVFGGQIDIGAYEFGAQDQLSSLRKQVQTLMGLNSGNRNSLLAKLDLRGNHGDLGKLQAFINEVQSLLKTHKISQADAASLVLAAQDVLASLG
jgi:hypothetical protein